MQEVLNTLNGSNSLEQTILLRELKNEVVKLVTKTCNYFFKQLTVATLSFCYNSLHLIKSENVCYGQKTVAFISASEKKMSKGVFTYQPYCLIASTAVQIPSLCMNHLIGMDDLFNFR